MTTVAVHEAAHAVVASALGVQVLYARIDGSDGGEFATARPFGELDVADHMILALAGGVATRQQFPESCGMDAVDVAHARLIASVMHGTREADPIVDDAITAWRAVAAVFVQQEWRWIWAVAEKLSAHGRLSGEEIAAMRPRGRSW